MCVEKICIFSIFFYLVGDSIGGKRGNYLWLREGKGIEAMNCTKKRKEKGCLLL